MWVPRVVVLLLVHGVASAASIEVFPGPGTPLQDAVDAAPVGGRITIHEGAYAEALVVSKRLRITAVGVVEIVPRCAAAIGLDVQADDVSIMATRGAGGSGGILFVQAQRAIRVAGRSNVKLKAVWGEGVVCASPGLRSEGIAIEASTRVSLTGCAGLGADAGVALRAMPLAARTTLVTTHGRGVVLPGEDGPLDPSPRSRVGLLVEDCGSGAAAGKGGIRIVPRTSSSNPIAFEGLVGMQVVASDGLLFQRGLLIGLALDGASDNNVFQRTDVVGDVVDAGAGNCGSHNRYIETETALAPCG